MRAGAGRFRDQSFGAFEPVMGRSRLKSDENRSAIADFAIAKPNAFSFRVNDVSLF